MNIRDITALSVKIAGIVLFVLVMSKIPEYVQSYALLRHSENSTNIFFFIAPLLIVAVACVMFLLYPYRISDQLLLKSDTDVKYSTIELEIIAFRVLGLLLLFWSASDLIYNITYYAILSGSTGYPEEKYEYPAQIATIVEIFIAYFLLKRTHQIVKFLDLNSK